MKGLLLTYKHTEATIKPMTEENHWFVCYHQEMKPSWTDRAWGTLDEIKESVTKNLEFFEASYGCY